MLRMTKNERSLAEATVAMTLRGATNGTSAAATEAAIAGLDADFFSELADELWTQAGAAILDAGIIFAGPLTESDRGRLIDEICKRLAEAMRAPDSSHRHCLRIYIRTAELRQGRPLPEPCLSCEGAAFFVRNQRSEKEEAK
jgi:hypothetical protein